ncbi:MAG TPA: hypothetical protein VFQ00_10705 [Terriglobales bacterium]|nr:hypothetical protein [Terriglobales bacterium]
MKILLAALLCLLCAGCALDATSTMAPAFFAESGEAQSAPAPKQAQAQVSSPAGTDHRSDSAATAPSRSSVPNISAAGQHGGA